MKGFKYAVRLVKQMARDSNRNCYKILNVFGTILTFSDSAETEMSSNKEVGAIRVPNVSKAGGTFVYKCITNIQESPSCGILIIPLWIYSIEVKFIAYVPFLIWGNFTCFFFRSITW